MNAEWSLAALLDLTAREAAKLMVADRASIFLWDREKGELWSQVALGSQPIRFDACFGIAGAVALTGQIINVKVEALEKRFITEALQVRRSNQFQAAKMLGLSRQGLMKKMKRYGIRAV